MREFILLKGYRTLTGGFEVALPDNREECLSESPEENRRILVNQKDDRRNAELDGKNRQNIRCQRRFKLSQDDFVH